MSVSYAAPIGTKIEKACACVRVRRSLTHTKKYPLNKAFFHLARVCELNLRPSESGRDTSRRTHSVKDKSKNGLYGIGDFTRTLTRACKNPCGSASSVCEWYSY